MMIRILAFSSFFLFFILQSHAQDACTKNSKWWSEFERFTPHEPVTVCTLRVNFIVPQKSDGSLNFQEDDEVNAKIWKEVMREINGLYSKLYDPKDDACYKGDDFIQDTYIRFKLNEVIYIQDDSMWNAANGTGCPRENNWWLNEIDEKIRVDPRYERAINVYMPNGPGDEYGLLPDGTKDTTPGKPPCSEMPTYRNLGRSSRINLAGAYNKYLYMRYIVPNDKTVNPDGRPWDPTIMQWHYSTVGHTLAHELGHSLGLAHSNKHHGRNKCEHALMNQLHGKPHDYIPPPEIGRMHRTLRMSNIRDFLVEDFYSKVPLTITDTVTMDISHKSYEDIIVRAGGQLTVGCELIMPEQGALMVEPGATLIIDEATVRGRGSDGDWKGIITLRERGWFWKEKEVGQVVVRGENGLLVGASIRTKRMRRR